MAGIFESVIKTSPLGRWYIELTDTIKLDTEPTICMDVYEYADKIEELGKEYNGVVEVIWSSDEKVTPEQINEVRMQMNAYEAEQETIRNGESHLADGTPNFSSPDDHEDA
ncbi:MAG: hypothetical protein LGB07_00555 [Sulfurovum sp.]|nr:hypothetical protein [Sulfurovum sp.]MCB4758381.1 hypothetical protein [Sulfurovum sp.]MCB4764219.1 hypothetical protein [Sulfurovum sp.]MCB4765913.1 hypothetical protein [Sulfurovum sp.]MCB4772762.1 hypothetical protein [Sulfurovum sp.]